VTYLAGERADNRRSQLADAALEALSEQGYARTSMRDIEQFAGYSHGGLNYYFRDKADLILFCIKRYKTQCATRYDYVIATAETPEEMLDGFAGKLVESLVQEGRFHRLWYDVRVQAMYVAEYQPDVLAVDALLEDMTWRIVSRYAELCGRPVGLPSPVLYGCLDGVFQQALLDHLAGRDGVPQELAATARGALPLFLGHA
jgi:TetR/AcrR family transcriptional repressor of bet genes